MSFMVDRFWRTSWIDTSWLSEDCKVALDKAADTYEATGICQPHSILLLPSGIYQGCVVCMKAVA